MLLQSIERSHVATMSVVVTDTAFMFNSGLYTDRGGGCIGIAGVRSYVTFTHCRFRNNDGGRGAGGAIYITGSSIVSILFSEFARNKANWGGALYAQEVSIDSYRAP